jgi:hypothetical protein
MVKRKSVSLLFCHTVYMICGQGIQRMTQDLGVDWNRESDMLSVDPRDILDKTT